MRPGRATPLGQRDRVSGGNGSQKRKLEVGNQQFLLSDVCSGKKENL